jgi:hypothetical protein
MRSGWAARRPVLVLAAVVVAVLAVVTAGCGAGGRVAAPGVPSGSGSGLGSASGSGAPGLGSPVPTPSATRPHRIVVETERAAYTQFITPSDNIGCLISRMYVRCDIDEHHWRLPPKPADCDSDWGPGTILDARAHVGICASDSAHGGVTRVLAYGHALRLGRYRCDSSETGLRCKNLRTGHGFLISRARYKLV